MGCWTNTGYGRMLVTGLESSQSCLVVGMRRAAPSFLLSALREFIVAKMGYSACTRLDANKKPHEHSNDLTPPPRTRNTYTPVSLLRRLYCEPN